MLFAENNLLFVLLSCVVYNLIKSSKDFQHCFDGSISGTMNLGCIYFNLLTFCYLKLFFISLLEVLTEKC